MTVEQALAWADREIAKKTDPRWCPMPDIDEVEALAAEVRRLRSDLAEERQEHQATLAYAAALRQRHAEARSILCDLEWDGAYRSDDPASDIIGIEHCPVCDGARNKGHVPSCSLGAWLASEAKARLT